jgi:hypothetical protein
MQLQIDPKLLLVSEKIKPEIHENVLSRFWDEAKHERQLRQREFLGNYQEPTPELISESIRFAFD